jgi:hypothetical protein
MEISIPKCSRNEAEKHPSPGQSDEEIDICEIQLSYSTLLSRLTKLGFAFLLATFAPYFFGILGNYVPRHLLAQYWGQPLFQYLKLTQVKTGWNWLWELHHGDFLNLLPMAFLASITIICLATVTIRFFRNREPLQGIIAILEIIVLVVAASGLLKAGGH